MRRSATRAALGRRLPYRTIEVGRRLLYAGFLRCPVCGARIRRFLDEGYGYSLLEELQVVGGLYRPADRCPICHAAARERLVWFYLERHLFTTDSNPIRVFHVAPEKGLTRYLRNKSRIFYRSGDIQPRRYRHVPGIEEVNLLNLPFSDAEIDLFLCCHVLEHIADDLKAMREIRRVLTPSGRAVLQVPLSLRLLQTREGDGTESPEEKIQLYGQRDHARIYAAEDYPKRLADAGFAVERYSAFDEDAAAAAKFRLDPFEQLHVCRPAKAGACT